MKGLWQSIFILTFFGLFLAGCLAEKKYEAYTDTKRKGKKIFLKDVQSCQAFSNESIKRSEGSKGAGELLREKNFIFISCMKRNDWILKG